PPRRAPRLRRASRPPRSRTLGAAATRPARNPPRPRANVPRVPVSWVHPRAAPGQRSFEVQRVAPVLDRRAVAVRGLLVLHLLRGRVDGEVRFDAGSRGTYSTDASNYRQVPVGVVVPRTVEAGAETVAVCAEHGVPVVSRGGGTSLAGQACNAAVVIDWSKY